MSTKLNLTPPKLDEDGKLKINKDSLISEKFTPLEIALGIVAIIIAKTLFL